MNDNSNDDHIMETKQQIKRGRKPLNLSPEEMKARKRTIYNKWYSKPENKDKDKIRTAKYRENNKDKISLQHKKKYQDNRDKFILKYQQGTIYQRNVIKKKIRSIINENKLPNLYKTEMNMLVDRIFNNNDICEIELINIINNIFLDE